MEDAAHPTVTSNIAPQTPPGPKDHDGGDDEDFDDDDEDGRDDDDDGNERDEAKDEAKIWPRQKGQGYAVP